MKENKDQPIRISTCFEESSSAEMMRRIMSEQGIGSLCEEMMRSLVRKTEVMEEENDQEHESAQDKKNNQKTGGMK